MKKKDMIERIKTQALDEMPDVLNKIDLGKIHIEEKPEKVKSAFNLRRAVSFAMSAFVLVISAFLVYNYAVLPNTPNLTPLSGESELIGFQTVSAASMLDLSAVTNMAYEEPVNDYVTVLSSSTTTQTTEIPTTTQSELTSTTESADLTTQMDLINSYLNMMETVIGNQNQMMYQSIESDNPDYQYAIEFKSTDLNGNLIEYKIYYNKTLEGDKYNIEGIMQFNDYSFTFSGTVGKNNAVTNTQFTTYIDQQNYVQVRNLSTEKTQVFAYKIVRNSQVYNESTVKLESIKSAVQATIQTTNKNEAMNLTVQKQMSDNGNRFAITYNIMNQGVEKTGNFQVGLQKDEATGKYMYSYHFDDSNNPITGPRNSKGNKPANSDDFRKKQGQVNNQNNNPSTTTTDEFGNNSASSGNKNTNEGNADNSNRFGPSGQTYDQTEYIESLSL